MLRRALLALACLSALSLTSGCGDACLSLASQICRCLPDDGTRVACNRRAKESEATFPVRPEDSAWCQRQLDAQACDCTKLGTPEGKRGCGLAYQVLGP